MRSKPLIPFDLHVLGTPPAFVLSQDQTLQLKPGLRSGSDRVPKAIDHADRVVQIKNWETRFFYKTARRVFPPRRTARYSVFKDQARRLAPVASARGQRRFGVAESHPLETGRPSVCVLVEAVKPTIFTAFRWVPAGRLEPLPTPGGPT